MNHIASALSRPMVALAALSLAGTAFLLGSGPLDREVGSVPPAGPELARIPRIGDFTVQFPELPAGGVVDGLPGELPDALAVSVMLGPDAVDLQLQKHSVRSDMFQVLVQGDGGVLESVPAPPVVTYRGTAAGHPDSRVTASIIAGRLNAVIELEPGASPWIVQPASDFPDANLPAGSHVSFRSSDVAPNGFSCGVTDEPREIEGAGAAAAGPADDAGDEICELAADADVFFFFENSSSVAQTVQDVETIMNTVEFVYERDVQITYEVTVVVVRTSVGADPYSSSNPDVLLCQFRDQWNASPLSLAKRDVAQLYTGRTLGGNIGLAWNGTICNVQATSTCGGGSQNLAYSLVESRFSGATLDERVSLSAHELGHNWNAPHCAGSQCFIMCDNIDGFGCAGTTGPNLKFGPNSINFITAFRNTRTCIPVQPPSQTVPFLEEFPTTIIDGDKWTWSNLAGITGTSSNPPSAPNALQLRSFGALEFRDAEIRTNFIELDGLADLVVEYETQHAGVESGESLIVEYWASTYQWLNLATIVSDGVDQTEFVAHQHDLDLVSAPYHDEFRLRFRVEGDETNDTWFVDDVYVGPLRVGACCLDGNCGVFSEENCMFVAGTYLGDFTDCDPNPCIAPPCPEDLDGSGDVGFGDILQIIGAWGPCVGCPEDLSGNDNVDFADILIVIGAWGPC